MLRSQDELFYGLVPVRRDLMPEENGRAVPRLARRATRVIVPARTGPRLRPVLARAGQGIPSEKFLDDSRLRPPRPAPGPRRARPGARRSRTSNPHDLSGTIFVRLFFLIGGCSENVAVTGG